MRTIHPLFSVSVCVLPLQLYGIDPCHGLCEGVRCVTKRHNSLPNLYNYLFGSGGGGMGSDSIHCVICISRYAITFNTTRRRLLVQKLSDFREHTAYYSSHFSISPSNGALFQAQKNRRKHEDVLLFVHLNIFATTTTQRERDRDNRIWNKKNFSILIQKKTK